VQAGFASPADDFIEQYLDLNELLVEHEQATYFVRVAGRSMIDAGIYPDDILIVDRSLDAKHRSIIIAVLDGEVTVKRLHNQNGKVFLKAENPAYKDIPILGELHVWGVVTSVIHRFS
jgi:DNA polymerase V